MINTSNTHKSNNIIPRHVAIVMDGNGRWAQQRGKSRMVGHRAGVNAIEKVMRAANDAGVEVLSLFAFSSENWRRPKKEVRYLMRLVSVFRSQAKKLCENNIKLYVVGEMEGLSKSVREITTETLRLTQNNTGLKLVIALNYGGQWDIMQAAKRLAEQVLKKEILLDEINEDIFSKNLVTSELPPVDLFIRPSGVQRISNFFLWQVAYAELYFPDVLWPDFDENAFHQALKFFAGNERRFGKTGEQVKEESHV